VEHLQWVDYMRCIEHHATVCVVLHKLCLESPEILSAQATHERHQARLVSAEHTRDHRPATLRRRHRHPTSSQ
jgi:hypothetical protein